MSQSVEVPKGKDTLNLWITDHTYVRLVNSEGDETFRSDSPGKHVTAIVQPGRFTIETDGKMEKVEPASLPSNLRSGGEFDATKPPMLTEKR